ncbi:MAG TPA: glycosyltransferase family 2 protein [Thermoanaerobaculia bacterium]|nr:glycosyltransferase family 2 protein [Thermoanaerobaculia bacterium]
MSEPWLSVIIPCYNEERAIAAEIGGLRQALGGLGACEIIVVDDGSTDQTAAQLDELSSAEPAGSEAPGGGRELLLVRTPGALQVVRHARNRGYGAAIKTGLRHARGEWVLIVDADGTYPLEAIREMVRMLAEADMVVGARTAADVIYPHSRRIAKWFLRLALRWFVGRDVEDMNSGMRIFRRDLALRYWKFFPDGFSFTTTLTLIALVNGFTVRYVPIQYRERVGRSKIRPLRDTLGFLQLILRTGFYFEPLRVFLPVIAVVGAATAAAIAWDVLVEDNLTDKTVILVLFLLNISLLALLADMIDKRSDR